MGHGVQLYQSHVHPLEQRKRPPSLPVDSVLVELRHLRNRVNRYLSEHGYASVPMAVGQSGVEEESVESARTMCFATC